MNHEAAQPLHANVVDALYAYMVDCRFGEAHLNAISLSFALEYVYRPHQRFWRQFDLEYLVTAVTRCVPNWRAALERTSSGAADKLLRDVNEFLRVRAFDEANAEILMALPVHERPSDGASAFAWISGELLKKGLRTELDFARRDGNTCGEQALDALHCLEAAAAGRRVDRTGALVARVCRDAAMKHQTEVSFC